MEDARKKVRLCLRMVLVSAVIVGLIYYFHDVKDPEGSIAEKGVLIVEDIGQTGQTLWETLIKGERGASGLWQ